MTLSEFFFDVPIYHNIQITNENYDIFRKIIDCHNKEEFQGYNPWAKLESTFVVISDLQPSGNGYENNGGYGNVTIKCKRTDDVFRYFIFFNSNNKVLIKVGQHPTVADFHISEVKQYNKLLSNEKLKEFTKAIGLAANGVGIGSFVYLRRIFESLIFDAYEKALSEKAVSESDFQTARMDKKIDFLKSYLPQFLVETKEMYSILSLGIHELNEQTCLAHFDALRVGIEIILDEKLDELRKKEKIEQAQNKLKMIRSQIKR